MKASTTGVIIRTRAHLLVLLHVVDGLVPLEPGVEAEEEAHVHGEDEDDPADEDHHDLDHRRVPRLGLADAARAEGLLKHRPRITEVKVT